jgi:hypothetical protein
MLTGVAAALLPRARRFPRRAHVGVVLLADVFRLGSRKGHKPRFTLAGTGVYEMSHTDFG